MIMRTNTSTRVCAAHLWERACSRNALCQSAHLQLIHRVREQARSHRGIAVKPTKKARHPERMARLFLLADSWLSCRRQSSARSIQTRCGCCCAAPDHYPPRQSA
ncbi:hypothetical protein DMX04_26545 [Pseudomonas koreensis]|nr:hypothetical protein DMX04_26545 [Pseudomonas koreensis]